jgi:hypothetical protein
MSLPLLCQILALILFAADVIVGLRTTAGVGRYRLASLGLFFVVLSVLISGSLKMP